MGVPLNEAVRELLLDGANDGVPDGIWFPTGRGASLVGGTILYLSKVGVPGILELPETGAVLAALDSRWSWYARACKWYCLCLDWFHDASSGVLVGITVGSSSLSRFNQGKKECRFLSVEVRREMILAGRSRDLEVVNFGRVVSVLEVGDTGSLFAGSKLR